MLIDKYWLCNFTDNYQVEDIPKELLNLWSCNWLHYLENPVIEKLFSCCNEEITSTSSSTTTTSLLTRITSLLKPIDGKSLLTIAIASLQAFIQDNFVGPKLSKTYETLPYRRSFDVINLQKLQQQFLIVDSEEPNVNVTYSELLILSKIILQHLMDGCLAVEDSHQHQQNGDVQQFDEVFIIDWWYLRLLNIHQQILDEKTNFLYTKFCFYTEKLCNRLNSIQNDGDQMNIITNHNELQSLLYLEVIQGYLMYRRLWKSEEYFDKIKDLLSVDIHVEGMLGVRTKYQQKPLPQLNLQININNELPFSSVTHKNTKLPSLLKLDDDVRLERVKFINEDDNRILQLPSIGQVLLLAKLHLTKQSQPSDKLANEELMPYITSLLYQDYGPWYVRVNTLLLNINLESRHKRTVERSLKQCEELMNIILATGGDDPVFQRFSYAYSSFICPMWIIKNQLGSLLISLGLIKTALTIYLDIKSWENVINCYTILDLKHKAAEIIRQELEKKPSVELYCLLGDATDDTKWYERAWEYSGYRSGRAQRHWGYYYFKEKDYVNCIKHLQKSLEINSLQENAWTRLGYAALTLEHWDLAATAYRRYTQIEPMGYESWNNLAKAYIKLGDKKRAQKILCESLKCNFNNWKIWENFLIVSTDTGNFDDVINAYNRLIELKDKYLDKEVLEILVNAVKNDIPDANGKPSKYLNKKLQSLLGHLCVQYPSDGLLWELAAKLCNENESLAKAQKLQKAYRCYTQLQNPWPKNPISCMKVLNVCKELCEASLEAINNHREFEKSSVLSQLSSARLSAQGSIRAASEEKWDNCDELIKVLNDYLELIKNQLLNHL